MPNICIIGGGISGLAHAWQLQQAGHAVTVLEANSRVGGAMDSFQADGFLAEAGPNSIQVNSLEVERFLASIPGLAERTVEANPAATKRFIVRNGRVRPVPSGPISAITTPLWSFAGKLRVLKEPFIPAADPESGESVADFVKRRLGDELYQYAINPLVGGIYAGRPEKLSLRYAFPKLYNLEQTHGGLIRGAIAKQRAAKQSDAPKVRKRIISYQNGIAELPAALGRALGDSVHTDVAIQAIESQGKTWTIEWTQSGEAQKASFDQLILTLPAHKLKTLPLPDDLLQTLAPVDVVEYPPVSVLSLGFHRDAVQHPLDGFGALIPEAEQRKLLGVLFPSTVFTGRAPKDHVLMTAFIGGARQAELATADTDRLLQCVLPELESLLGVRSQPVFTYHRHWPLAIPQYTLGYQQVLDAADQAEALYPNLRITGNYRHGISVTNCIETAVAYQV